MLHSLDLLDSEPEAEFDALVALAAEMLDCPTAMLTLIDRDRQWVKAREGDGPDQICRSAAFCDHTIRRDAPFAVKDARGDQRFAANPLVTGPEQLRFYAGAPIHASDHDGISRAIGAVCVIDRRPRRFDTGHRTALAKLAKLAEALIAARTAARRALAVAAQSELQAAEIERRDRTLRQAERIAQIGSWRYSIAEDRLDWSEGAYRVHELDPQPLSVNEALDYYPPIARARVSAALANTIETGAPFDIQEELITARGARRRLHAMAELEWSDGRPAAIVGVLQDVTDRHALETQLRRSADTDALTQVASRAAFDRALESALARHRADGAPLLLAMIDLDGFKTINDTFGHLAGDDVLRAVGRALSQPWVRGGFAARLGGDEFALIVDDPLLTAAPERLRERLTAALQVSVPAAGLTFTAAGTVGLALADPACAGPRDLVRRADADLYAAKRARVGERRGRERRAAS